LAHKEPFDGGLRIIQKQGDRFPKLLDLYTFIKRIDDDVTIMLPQEQFE
jgi:hypothetical protein